jgi:hypothetical protein
MGSGNVCIIVTMVSQSYMKLLEWVNYLAVVYNDWVINFPLQYINGWGYLSYDISMGGDI